MSDRLEDIKKKPFQRPLQVVTDGDILWLIAEVERLRDEHEQLKICWHGEAEWHVERYKKLEAERDELLIGGAKQPIFTIKQLEAEIVTSEKIIKQYRQKLNASEAENASIEIERIKERERAVLAEERLRVANRDLAASEKARKDAEERVKTLFDRIRHGDDDHQAWLAHTIEEHFK